MNYDVVVEGFSLDSAEAPARVLGRVLGVSAEQATALIRVLPATVVAQAERSQAAQVAALLRAAGVRVEVRESAQEGPGRPFDHGRNAARASGAGVTVAGPRVAHAARTARTVAAAITPSRELSVEGGAVRDLPSSAGVVSAQAATTRALDEAVERGAHQAGSAPYVLGDLDVGAAAPALLPRLADAAEARESLELTGQAAKGAPVRVAAEVTASGDAGGMQGFGDGLDDADTGGPGLELDPGGEWRTNVPRAAATPVRARSASGSQRGVGERAVPPVRASGAGVATRAQASALAVPSHLARLAGHLGSIVVALLAATALLVPMAYLRDSTATAQLLAGTSPPSVTPTVERVLRRAQAMAGPLPAPRNPPVAEVSGLPFVPMEGNPEATLTPIVRLAPRAARASLGLLLRSRIPDVVAVDVDWPEEDVERGSGADCFLVTHASPGVAQRRIEALLRTGRWVDVPYDAQRQLAAHIKRSTDGSAVGAPLTAACLAR